MATLTLDRNSLKAQIRQKLQEKILVSSTSKEDYSVGGFFKNVGSEAGEIVRGIGSLLGMAGKAIIHPIETAQFISSPEFPQALKQIGSSIVESYKGYKEPLKKFYNEPIGVVTDALVVATLGGAGITKVGTAAKIPELVKAGGVVSAAGKPIALTKDLAKFTISKIPGGPEFLTSLSQRAKTIEVLGSAQRAHLVELNKTLAEVDTILSKLSSQERQTLIPFAEKRVTLPFAPSENFNKAVGLVDKLAKQREALIGPEGIGKLTAEQIVARKWQPVLKQLYGDEAVSLEAKAPTVAKELQPLAQEQFKPFSPLGNKDLALEKQALSLARMGTGGYEIGEVYWQKVASGNRPVQITKVNPDGSVEGWYLGSKAQIEKQFGTTPDSLLPAKWSNPSKELFIGESNQRQLDDFISKVFKIEKPKQLTSGIPQELQPLAKEARKYKSAEEFVRGYKQFSEAEKQAVNVLNKYGDKNIDVYGSFSTLARRGSGKKLPDLDIIIEDKSISADF